MKDLVSKSVLIAEGGSKIFKIVWRHKLTSRKQILHFLDSLSSVPGASDFHGSYINVLPPKSASHCSPIEEEKCTEFLYPPTINIVPGSTSSLKKCPSSNLSFLQSVWFWHFFILSLIFFCLNLTFWPLYKLFRRQTGTCVV